MWGGDENCEAGELGAPGAESGARHRIAVFACLVREGIEPGSTVITLAGLGGSGVTGFDSC